jgi:hypothetical protein
MIKTFLIALFLVIVLSSAPAGGSNDLKNSNFLIDPSKHYVYLKFAHVGNREPLSPSESHKGLWLLLVNNCRLPITVAIFNTENPGPDHGIGAYDEVVRLPMKAPTVQFSTPDKTHAIPTSLSAQKPPEGYSLPHVFSTTTISPGENLLFNLPLNHVGPSWYLQVRFYFELPGEGYGTGPYSVVSFDWQDIPEEFREQEAAPVPHKPTTQ